MNKETGFNPASRIPTGRLSHLAKKVENEFSFLFDKIKFVSNQDLLGKADHGDIDFVVLKKKDTVDRFFKFTESTNIKWTKKNGNMLHILYPFDDESLYQVDFIMANDELEYKTCKFFYTQPTVFNAVLGHFSRSIGYKFSTDGLLLHITDKKGQNYYYLLSREIDTILKLLCLKSVDTNSLYQSAESFANWIIESPRFDCNMFKRSENNRSHRDAKIDQFCSDVYHRLESATDKKCSMAPSHINFRDDSFDLSKALKFEREILGDDIVQNVLDFCKDKETIREPIIRGDMLMEMGFPKGKILGDIIKDVSEKFGEEENIDVIKKYIVEKYTIEV